MGIREDLLEVVTSNRDLDEWWMAMWWLWGGGRGVVVELLRLTWLYGHGVI